MSYPDPQNALRSSNGSTTKSARDSEQASKNSEVQTQEQLLRGEVQYLIGMVDALETCLYPVLRTQGAQHQEKGVVSSEQSCCSPLGQSLNATSRELQGVCAKLRMILDNLEI